MTAAEHVFTTAELFADAPFDAGTLAAMMEAYAAACQDLDIACDIYAGQLGNEIRLQLVVRILKAAATGERDPNFLKMLALRSIPNEIEALNRKL
jgi:hypothetical protein